MTLIWIKVHAEEDGGTDELVGHEGSGFELIAPFHRLKGEWEPIGVVDAVFLGFKFFQHVPNMSRKVGPSLFKNSSVPDILLS